MLEPPQKIAVVLPNGLEYSSRLMTGVNYFRDENPQCEPFEFRFTDERLDPLPVDLSQFQGAIAWVDRGCTWLSRLLADSIKVVNCCFDWQGTRGVASIGLDMELSCDIVLAHALSLAPKQFAVIGVDFADRPHTAALCELMAARAREDGLDAIVYELSGPHPDELRSRMSEVSQEEPLLQFLSGLKRPAVVWCENDFLARMVCNAARYAEIAVPHQLAVIGCGDYRVAIHHSPTITTLPRPAEEIGYAAAQMLCHWIANEQQPPADITVAPGSLLLRQSSVNSINWDKIRMARELIQAEACNGLTVERICRKIELSKMTFTKRYSELYGTTPGADISQQKVDQAIKLLRETSQSIAEIGNALGFSEQSKFSKFFKRHTGRTPSEFRQST